MEHAARRVVDDERLAGLWVAHSFSGWCWYAPARLPDGAWGLAQVEIARAAEVPVWVGRWWLFGRSGIEATGELALPPVRFWQALAHVERQLGERGVRFDAGRRVDG